MSDIPSFTCPRCGRTSYNPNDISEKYCGACHDFMGDSSPDNPDQIFEDLKPLIIKYGRDPLIRVLETVRIT